jgi:Phosphotransferase enzyme family
MVNNIGTIPPSQDTPGDFVWNRGFSVVVVGKWGRPRYFCKCRAAGDARLRHEIETMNALSDDSELRCHVPPVQWERSDRLQVHITRYLAGTPLNGLLAHRFRSSRALGHIVNETVDVALTVSRRGTLVLDALVRQGREVDLASEAKPAIGYLTRVGFASDDCGVIQRALQGIPPLPRQLQHGDWWPANLIRHGRSMWVVDFEHYGEVQVPMYDVFHFLRTCSDLWVTAGAGDSWLDRMRDVTAPGTRLLREAACRAAAELGLTTDQAVGALIYYIVDFGVTMHRRNPDGRVPIRFVEEIRRLVALLRDAPSPKAVLSAT